MKKVGIIGRGQFTNFIVPILEKYVEVEIFDREGVENFSLQGKGSKFDYLIFSVPLSSIEEVCKKIADKVSEDTAHDLANMVFYASKKAKFNSNIVMLHCEDVLSIAIKA
jgi:prephenate dehydrogenase